LTLLKNAQLTQIIAIQSCYIANKQLKKPKGVKRPEELKKRAIAVILDSFQQLVEASGGFKTSHGENVYLPAEEAGPAFPTNESIANWARLKAAAKDNQLELFDVLGRAHCSSIIGSLQQYVLVPTSDHLDQALDEIYNTSTATRQGYVGRASDPIDSIPSFLLRLPDAIKSLESPGVHCSVVKKLFASPLNDKEQARVQTLLQISTIIGRPSGKFEWSWYGNVKGRESTFAHIRSHTDLF
jgi:hypothetical protein